MDSTKQEVAEELAETARQVVGVSKDVKIYQGEEVNKAGRAHKVITVDQLKQENEQLLKIIQSQKKEIDNLV